MKVKLDTDDLWILGYLLPSLLIGGIAYRACMFGRGWGNFPGNAWLAAFGTGSLAFVILLIIIEPWPRHTRVLIFICTSLVLGMIHLIGFR